MERTIIMVRVGCWESHLVVDFLPEDEPTLAEAGLTEGVDVIFEDDVLLLCPNTSGSNLTPIRKNNRSTSYVREFDLGVTPTSLGLARFCITEMEAVVEDGSLTIELPPPHRLPWFNITKDCPNRQDICIREFRNRMRSAVQAGETRLNVPGHIRRYIPRDIWIKTIEQARGEQSCISQLD